MITWEPVVPITVGGGLQPLLIMCLPYTPYDNHSSPDNRTGIRVSTNIREDSILLSKKECLTPTILHTPPLEVF